MISKRRLLAGLVAAASTAAIARSAAGRSPVISSGELRGSIDASAHGVVPGGGETTQRNLQRLLTEAAGRNMPVYLPPGDYPMSGIDLPDGSRLIGIAGATRLLLSGFGVLLQAENARHIELSDLIIDGAGRAPAGDAPALALFRNVADLVMENCDVVNGARTGLHLEACGGRISRNRMTRAAEYGLYAVNSANLTIADNIVSDCANGGILIHRWEKGRDGTIVSGNRISRTGAGNGGTGQYGNAINLYRADDVIVSGNHISDSAFSAIRANSASNAMISGNHCTASGETAIYAEFSFEGAMISGNLVDGAANGISVVNFNEGGRLATIANNIVRNLRPVGPYTVEDPIFGVGISAEADTAVTSNVVENAPYCGLAFGFGPYLRNVTATGNIVRDASVGCVVTVVEGAGDAIIANNIFQAARRGAIIGYRWREASTGDLAKDSAEQFSHLTIEGNRVS